MNNRERISKALVQAGLSEGTVVHTRVVWEQLGYALQENMIPLELKLWKKRQPKQGEDESSKKLFYLTSVKLYTEDQVELKEV